MGGVEWCVCVCVCEWEVSRCFVGIYVCICAISIPNVFSPPTTADLALLLLHLCSSSSSSHFSCFLSVIFSTVHLSHQHNHWAFPDAGPFHISFGAASHLANYWDSCHSQDVHDSGSYTTKATSAALLRMKILCIPM